ncbi:hypothetical protein [Pararobbsia silviterrae]|uniref:Uncharacterized protein n=1 Tax=Pararobbsia silviterrae TaxID=1792498 RepID=A0A494XGE3_9BURK|nr:hypothetical protein [Pararobbsia silviterrae]RKP46663.1 hypothetical protein D7S86_24545 [Pararobbsia silviterrae]
MNHASASTPIPLSRKREPAQNSAGAARLSEVGSLAHARTSANASKCEQIIQKDDVSPLARPDHIQMDESESTRRLAYLLRIKSIRALVGQLIDELARDNELELLDVMRDDQAPYSRYRNAEKARDMATGAGRQLQLGFMLLEHAVERPSEF